jgi:positive regulator of sigma E activity
MIENAVVCEIDNDTVSVILENECGESCGHCSKKNKKETIQVYNTSGLNIKKGDRVEIYAAPAKTILAGFLIFIVPLLLFVIFYFAGSLIFPSGDEAALFLCGISGIAFGFLLNLVISLVRRRKELPEITKILSD